MISVSPGSVYEVSTSGYMVYPPFRLVLGGVSHGAYVDEVVSFLSMG